MCPYLGRFERLKMNVGSMGQNGTAELDQMEKAMMHKEEKMMREWRVGARQM